MKAKIVNGAIVVKHIVPDDDMDDVVVEGDGEGEKWHVRDGKVICTKCDPGGSVPAPKPDAAANELAPAVAQMADMILKQRETIEALQSRVGQLESFQGALINTATRRA